MNDPHIPASEDRAAADARRLIEAVEDAYRPAAVVPTYYRDTSPVPAIGTAPPVPQPGRPAMSQRATDISGVVLSLGIASVPIGGSVSLVLWTAGQMDPVVIGIICGAPVAVLLALSRFLKRFREATPPEHHHHYNGPVIQQHNHNTSKTHGLIAHTRNELPR